MTTKNTMIQLTISFDAGNEPQSANMRIELGEASILLPLPDGLHFEGESPLSISLSFPNHYIHNQETNDALFRQNQQVVKKRRPRQPVRTKQTKSNCFYRLPVHRKLLQNTKHNGQSSVVKISSSTRLIF